MTGREREQERGLSLACLFSLIVAAIQQQLDLGQAESGI